MGLKINGAHMQETQGHRASSLSSPLGVPSLKATPTFFLASPRPFSSPSAPLFSSTGPCVFTFFFVFFFETADLGEGSCGEGCDNIGTAFRLALHSLWLRCSFHCILLV